MSHSVAYLIAGPDREGGTGACARPSSPACSLFSYRVRKYFDTI